MTGVLFLVRHGQTALNAAGRFRGRRDVPLDDRGYAQAAEVSRQLRVTAVYASPLLRTVETAQLLANSSGVRIMKLEGLLDLDHGRWEGLTSEEAARERSGGVPAVPGGPAQCSGTRR